MGLVWTSAGAVTHQDELQSLVGQTKHLQPSGLARKSTVLVFEYIEARILHKNMNEHIFSVVKSILRTSSARE